MEEEPATPTPRPFGNAEGEDENANNPEARDGTRAGGSSAFGYGRIAQVLLIVPVLLILLAAALPVAERIAAGLDFPYQIDPEEGFVLFQATELRDGRPIYKPIDEEPYGVANYPPIYPWLISLAIREGGYGVTAGRTIVLLFSGLIGLMLIGLCLAYGGKLLPSLLAPLLFFVSYEFYDWSVACRVDLPALGFTSAGLAAFALSRSRWNTALAALLFVLAGFTRQTSVFAPAACVLWMLARDRGRLLAFVVPYAALGLSGLGIAEMRTDGEFLRHTVLYNRNEMNWTILGRILRNEIWFFYQWRLIALAAGAVTLALCAWADRKNDDLPSVALAASPPAPGLPGVYFVFAAMSLVGFAKVGSAPNYGLEFLFALSWWGMATLGRVATQTEHRRAAVRRLAWVGFCLFIAAQFLGATRLLPFPLEARLGAEGARGSMARVFDQRSVRPMIFSSPIPTDADSRAGAEVIRWLRLFRGEVLSERPVFTLFAGKAVVMEPYVMTLLAREGVWDESAIVADFNAGRFDAIVTTVDLTEVESGRQFVRYTDAMARAIVQSYKPAGVVRPEGLRAPYYLWVRDETALRARRTATSKKQEP